MRRVDHISHEIFDDTPIAEGLNEEERSQLTQITERHLYEEGEIVVREGDESRDLFALKSGRVEVTKMDAGAQERQLALLEPDTVFGEIGYVLGTPRSATVRAVRGSELLCVDGGAAKTLRDAGKLVAYKVEHNLFRMLAERQSDLNAELLDFMGREEPSGPRDEYSEVRQRLLEKWRF